jgi:hypothetical protein
MMYDVLRDGMFEMTNENVARLLRGLTIAVGNRKNRILIYQFLAAEIRALRRPLPEDNGLAGAPDCKVVKR